MLVISSELLSLFFFFQAEDGIRDLIVTGVQTCALPISHRIIRAVRPAHDDVNFIAWSRVPFANRRGESMRSPPLRYLFCLGACFPNQFTRRIEFPRDNKFLSDLILRFSLSCHISRLLLKPGTRRAAAPNPSLNPGSRRGLSARDRENCRCRPGDQGRARRPSRCERRRRFHPY